MVFQYVTYAKIKQDVVQIHEYKNTKTTTKKTQNKGATQVMDSILHMLTTGRTYSFNLQSFQPPLQ